MDVLEVLANLKERAEKDAPLKQKLLETKKSSAPLEAFCTICREEGYELYEMDLIEAGETFYASMKRSTNGGGENSPMLEGQDDLYELFLTELAWSSSADK
ncbi:MAG: hypothetical protein ACOX60_08685 [Massiliimalia sp.]|jgi:hypothetical protein